MKKLISLALGTALAITASAQSWQDALLFTENEYGGTARSVAMGNAFTAVGGDLGSIGLNPAGSAVAGYSQFALSPGISLNVANASSANPDLAYGDQVRTLFTRIKMPNLGFTIAMDTGHRSGFKRLTFGFLSNSTSDFTSRMYASGINATNSYCGSLASSAAGYPEEALSGSSSKYTWWNLDDYNETYLMSWEDMVGYRSALFGTVNGRYLGLTDWNKDGKNTGVLAPLYQKYGFQTKGFKHDMLFNVGANYEDTFYLGANMGITLLSYGQSEYWYEQPNNDAEFPAIPFDTNPNARFRNLESKRIFAAKGGGIYLKVGALWRLGALRLGGAVQTPTFMNIDTRMACYSKAQVDGVNLSAAQSPEWEDSYSIVSPWRFNAGLALTLGQVALLSVDYEMAHYGKTHLRGRSESAVYYSSGYFDDVNADIRDVLGKSRMLRVGAEVKVTPAVALRAGYGLTTSAMYNYLDWEYNPADGKEYLKVYELTAQERAALCRHYFSAGAGFTNGPFFADVALRYKARFNQYYTPYYYYDYDGTDYTNKYAVDAVPEITGVHNRFEAIVTFGWRF